MMMMGGRGRGGGGGGGGEGKEGSSEGAPSERGRGRRGGRRLKEPFHTFGKETRAGEKGLRTGRRRRLPAPGPLAREEARQEPRRRGDPGPRAGASAATAQAVTSSVSPRGRRCQQPEPDSLTSRRETLRGR